MQAMTPSANHSPASHSSTSRAAPASSSSSNGKSDAASEIHQARSFGDADASKTSRFTLGQPARSLPSSSDEQPESALTTHPQEELGDLTALAALLSAHQPIPTQAQWVKGFAENHRVGSVNTANTAAAQNANANAAATSATGQSAAGLLNAQSALATSESQPAATKAALPLDSALNAALNQAIHPTSGAPSLGQAQAQVHAPSATTTVNAPEWASVRIDTQAGKWGEQMLQVLHDRVTLQAQQHLQEAKIRLDPPDLGKLDLVVRVEGDRLSVQINANAAATREALMQVSDRLRAELQSQNFVHVDVNVGADQSGQRQSSSQDEAATHPIFAARDSADEPFTASLSEHWLSTHA
ncbi:flagellar hook-length control protein FliK [Vibrio furnissii]|uniref:flagellar hook-length control protein FliK n=1 Tax=Vibrio furnissii TaxID=29494 RepID=UPI000200C9AB|nr:flagellar hook-length control protein FliK [Vibrio furnissii]ADT86568.1 lateral flagellar FliK-like protein - LafE [Vibrio furnissii NCTC 11218]